MKEKSEILFVSPVPIPESSKGAPVIASNDKIRLAVINKDDDIYYQKITGYVVVDPWFYELLIENWNDRHEKDKK